MIRTGLKIGFMGAGGTGKTTTAKAVSEALGIPTIKSASRAVYEQDNLTEEKCMALDDVGKYELQFRIFGMKTELDLKTFAFVADRTLLDHWAYCLMYCGAFIPNNEYTQFEKDVRVHMRSTYTHLFYFPFGYWFPAEADGVRQDHYSWQSAIDAIILGYIHRWRLPVTEVNQTGGAEARGSSVLNAIRRNV